MSSRKTLPRLSEAADIRRGILSPKEKKKGRSVRFEFPTQLMRVKNITQELDEMASSTLFNKSKSSIQMPKLKPRLHDAPISLVGYKPHIKKPSTDNTRKSAVLLTGGRGLSRSALAFRIPAKPVHP